MKGESSKEGAQPTNQDQRQARLTGTPKTESEWQEYEAKYLKERPLMKIFFDTIDRIEKQALKDLAGRELGGRTDEEDEEEEEQEENDDDSSEEESLQFEEQAELNEDEEKELNEEEALDVMEAAERPSNRLGYIPGSFLAQDYAEDSDGPDYTDPGQASNDGGEGDDEGSTSSDSSDEEEDREILDIE